MAHTIRLDLDERRAAALSRFLRNVKWSDLTAYAGDVEQALLMRDALDTIGRALVLGDTGRIARRVDLKKECEADSGRFPPNADQRSTR
ncbi:DUF7706 family protein [Cupriavidus necator]|uniref:DUF7706 family protein n=1 Tax=Cupriavidus necator TaxID=106590 RepID=UPI002780E170|nr:hypothetical protein [Cupriavidus necator]MDQ0141212.1 hypothetical protein [Cupriavidus necator]